MNLTVFTDQDFGSIRAMEIEGEPWFVGKDVANCLGFSNSRDAISNHVFPEDKGVETIDTLGGKQKLVVINESGLYAMVFNSRLPNAKKFKHWITSEVLPSIRKHGAYATPVTIEKIISNPDFGIRLLQSLKNEQEKNQELEKENKVLKPKGLFADAVAAADTSILVGQLAKILRQNGVKIGQNRLFRWMRDNGYLGKSGSNYNLPTQYSMDRKLFEIKESTFQNPDGSVRITRTPKVTGKGQQYFVNRFLTNGDS